MKHSNDYDENTLPERLRGLFPEVVEAILLPSYWANRGDVTPRQHWDWLLTAPIHEIDNWARSVLRDEEATR